MPDTGRRPACRFPGLRLFQKFNVGRRLLSAYRPPLQDANARDALDAVHDMDFCEVRDDDADGSSDRMVMWCVRRSDRRGRGVLCAMLDDIPGRRGLRVPDWNAKLKVANVGTVGRHRGKTLGFQSHL